MKRTAAVLALIALLAAARAAAAFTSPGGSWSAEVPAGWQAQPLPDTESMVDRVRFAGPMGPFVVLEICAWSGDLPLPALIQRTKRGLRDRHLEVLAESKDPVGSMPAWTYELVTESAQVRMRVLDAIVDAGARRLSVTLTGPDPLRPQEREVFTRVRASLAATAPTAQPPEFAPRQFARSGLEIELPAGGTVEEDDLALRVEWKERGLTFRAERRRTARTPEELAQADWTGDEAAESEGYALESLDREERTIGGTKCARVRVGLSDQKVRVMTSSLVYRPVGREEVVVYGFAQIGAAGSEGLARLEGSLDRARAEARLAAPAAQVPAFGEAAPEAWGGRVRLRLPAGWTETPVVARRARPGDPAVKEKRLWCAAGGADLGVRAEVVTVAGGAAAFEKWLRERAWRRRDRAEVGPARSVTVGGRAGQAWDVTYGPRADRWQAVMVAVFEGGEGLLIHASCPVRLAGAYGGLAERVAAAAEAGGK